MSYYLADYFKNPPSPYEHGSATRTVPGWGVSAAVAEGARIGVGATLTKADIARLHVRVPEPDEIYTPPTPTPAAPSKGIPWWVWIAAPGVLAGGLALSINMGWIGQGA